MFIEIIVNGATEEEKRILRGVAASFIGSGQVKVENCVKTPETTQKVQKWTFPRATPLSHDAPAILVVVNYKDVNKINEDKEVKKERDCATCGKPAREKGEEIPICESCFQKTERFIERNCVNDTRKDNQFPQDNEVPPNPPVARPPLPKQSTLFEKVTSIRDDIYDFIEFWKSQFWLPKLMGTDRQVKVIRKCLEREMFRENYRTALGEYSKSKFLRGIDGKDFKFTFDWFMEDDNFDKVLEGKYRDHETKPKVTKETKYVGDEKDF